MNILLCHQNSSFRIRIYFSHWAFKLTFTGVLCRTITFNYYVVYGVMKYKIPWQETLQGLPLLFFFRFIYSPSSCQYYLWQFFPYVRYSTLLLQGKDKFSNDHRIQQAIKKQKRKSCQMCDLKSFCLSKMVVDERFLYLLSKASLRRLETVLIKVRHRTFRVHLNIRWVWLRKLQK